MLIFSRPVAGLVLAAVAATAYGYERLPRRDPPTPDVAPAEAPKPPAPAALAAIAAPTPATMAEAPARMSSAQQAGFEAWLIKTYLGCWKPAPQPADSDIYVAQVRLAFNPDGSLAKPAKLVNPPSDPALKPQAKSVMLAVQSCNPLAVPAQYRPFYEQWKTKTIHFNPQVAAR
ncbi:MAG TPA: hypothetical protein VF886_18990 [Roseiarcus sp.]